MEENFAYKAEKRRPTLVEQTKPPQRVVNVVPSDEHIHGWKAEPVGGAEVLHDYTFGKGDSVVLDFGEHVVGYLQMNIVPVGSPPDAPLHLKLTMGEMPVEIGEPFEEYEGWLSSSWLQEEVYHVDILSEELHLPRRYTFRYVKLEVLDTSQKYRVQFSDVEAVHVTSASFEFPVKRLQTNEETDRIDRTAVTTLRNCMQFVFEDGPKRDQRLWLGDLRLQALTNYYTFKDTSLVERCLYLFAASVNEDGRVAANVFTQPKLIADDTYLFDFSAFFAATLYDLYDYGGVTETVTDLWPTALRQMELSFERLDERNVLIDDNTWWSFIDWHDDLNKQAASQGVLIYCVERAIMLAEGLDDPAVEMLKNKHRQLREAALAYLWDESAGYFLSGDSRQVSWASQVWMILAGVLDKQENRKLLERLDNDNITIRPMTPYLYHHLVEAYALSGDLERAMTEIKNYWGAMVDNGADTFWELFNPDDLQFSPYGSHIINSYCHAWSCTPSYLMRKYQLHEEARGL